MAALLISQEVFQSVFCWLLVINIYRQAGISKCVAMEVQRFYNFENLLLLEQVYGMEHCFGIKT